jgi:hypothetical protein
MRRVLTTVLVAACAAVAWAATIDITPPGAIRGAQASVLRIGARTIGGTITDGLIARWTFDEGAGTTAASTPTNYQGTLTNMESGDWVAGKFGTALLFDGSNEYVTVADNSALEGFSSATWCAWVRRAGSGGSGFGRVVDKSDAVTLNTDSSARAAITIGTSSAYSANSSLGTGWTHVCANYTGASIQMYVAGAASGSSVARSGSTPTNTYALVFGNRPAADRGWDGTIDDVRVYTPALSAAQIAQLAGE